MSKARVNRSKPGWVRIIGGKWRRRRLTVAGLPGLRPTPDRVRETLFNWLEPLISGSRCLDLFAGSGVLGFEALSRGATSVTLVDRDAAVVAALAKLDNELEAGAEIVRADAAQFMQRARVGMFDIVFVDAPYASAVDSVLESVRDRVTGSARIYLERRRGDRWPEIAGLEWLRHESAGGVSYGLARRESQPC